MENIGFCAVYFKDLGKYTRWAIRDEWQQVGEITLASVSQIVSSHTIPAAAESDGAYEDLVREMLVTLVLEAASEMDMKVIPCRSFALMQHLSWPFFLIEMSATSGTSIRQIDVKSSKEADKLIDKLETRAGDTRVRIRSNGDRTVVLSDRGGRPRNLPTGTLTGQLTPLEKHLQNTDPTIPKGLKPFLNRSLPKIWNKF